MNARLKPWETVGLGEGALVVELASHTEVVKLTRFEAQSLLDYMQRMRQYCEQANEPAKPKKTLAFCERGNGYNARTARYEMGKSDTKSNKQGSQ